MAMADILKILGIGLLRIVGIISGRFSDSYSGYKVGIHHLFLYKKLAGRLNPAEFKAKTISITYSSSSTMTSSTKRSFALVRSVSRPTIVSRERKSLSEAPSIA